MNLAHLLLRSARTLGQREAVFVGEQAVYDYATLARRAATLGQNLIRVHGLQPGDRVGLFMSNHAAVLEILFGCWWAGLVVVPINPKLHAREARYILDHSAVSLVFVSDDIGAALEAEAAHAAAERALPRVFVDSPSYQALVAAHLADDGSDLVAPASRDGADLAWLFYTSGTTGRPKGVMLTHRNLLTMTLCYFADVDPVQPQDAILYAAPMSHGAGLYCLPHVVAGTTWRAPATTRPRS